MNKSTLLSNARRACLAVSFLTACSTAAPQEMESIRRSVVKIYVTIQREDYLSPWQGGRAAHGTGSGFIISGRRILTNAHVVSDVRFLEVQKDGDPRRFKAKVRFIGHDCDLATLDVDDPSFFKGTVAVRFADTLPSLNDEVTAYGYPLGGDRLSITRGVVSRIDYAVYTHSGVDQHLVLQVDAAINPGNSGGPVTLDNKVVGLAFQGISQAQNIGYAIPMPVIRHFLKDIEDDRYDGYPELGVAFLETRNEALRRHLKVPPDNGGVALFYVDPFGSAKDSLRAGDVLLSVDKHPIANDGTIDLKGNRVVFHELLERKQWGESSIFSVWRNAAETNITVSLKNPADPFIFRNLYDETPRYFVAGGLMFSPLNREYLEAVDSRRKDNAVIQLNYYAQYAKIDSLYTNVDEFVVLSRRLPHPVNTYAHGFVNGIVSRVNGKAIRNLRDVKTAVQAPQEGFHVIQFAGEDDSLILDAEAARQADPEIFARYGIDSSEFFGGEP